MAVLLVTMYAGVGLNADVSKGIADRFRALPIWRPAPIAGAPLGDVARYLLAARLVVALGVAIGFRPAGGAPVVLAGIGLLLAFALCLSWAWTTLGLLLRTPQAVMSADTVVLFPLTLASNVFVAPHTMPGWMQAFVNVNPVSHLVTAERALLGGQPAAGQAAWVLLAAAILVAIFAPGHRLPLWQAPATGRRGIRQPGRPRQTQSPPGSAGNEDEGAKVTHPSRTAVQYLARIRSRAWHRPRRAQACCPCGRVGPPVCSGHCGEVTEAR